MVRGNTQVDFNIATQTPKPKVDETVDGDPEFKSKSPRGTYASLSSLWAEEQYVMDRVEASWKPLSY